MNFVSTHDIERAINRFGGQPCDGKSKDWMAQNSLSPEEYQRGKTLLKCAMVLQFFLPGVPSIYYGDEVACRAGKTRSTAAVSRGTMRTPNCWNSPSSWAASAAPARHSQRARWNFWCWRTIWWLLPLRC